MKSLTPDSFYSPNKDQFLGMQRVQSLFQVDLLPRLRLLPRVRAALEGLGLRVTETDYIEGYSIADGYTYTLYGFGPNEGFLNASVYLNLSYAPVYTAPNGQTLYYKEYVNQLPSLKLTQAIVVLAQGGPLVIPFLNQTLDTSVEALTARMGASFDI